MDAEVLGASIEPSLTDFSADLTIGFASFALGFEALETGSAVGVAGFPLTRGVPVVRSGFVAFRARSSGGSGNESNNPGV